MSRRWHCESVTRFVAVRPENEQASKAAPTSEWLGEVRIASRQPPVPSPESSLQNLEKAWARWRALRPCRMLRGRRLALSSKSEETCMAGVAPALDAKQEAATGEPKKERRITPTPGAYCAGARTSELNGEQKSPVVLALDPD